jgi:lysophospholipase L1-like esterase
MTVQLLAKWGDQPPGTLYTSDAATEAAMVTAKVATTSLASALPWTPPGSSPGAAALSPAQTAALRNWLAGGVSTVLFGDSMVAFFHQQLTATSTSYNTATGVLTITESGHGRTPSSLTQVFNYSYASLRDMRWLPITLIDANTYSVTLTDKPADLPSGALTGTTYTCSILRQTSNSPVSWVQRRQNQRLTFAAYSAQSGDWSDGALSRVARDVLAYAPRLVVMQALGINDQTLAYLGNSSRTEEQTVAALQSTFDQILAAGAQLIVMTITPVVTGEARATNIVMERVQRINRWIKSYAAGKPGRMAIVDAWDVCVIRSDASGLGTASYFKTTDQIHYSAYGSLQVAKKLEAVVTAWFPQFSSTLPGSTLDSQQNSSLTADSGAAAGGIVTITRSAGTGVRTGEWFKVSGATPSQANGCFRAIFGAANNQTFTYAAPGIADGALTGTVTFTRSLNLWPDPLMLGATDGPKLNGVTGTAVHDLFVTNTAGNTGTLTAAASIAAEPNGYGNEQLLTVTASAANDSPSFGTNTSTARAAMIPGRTYQFECQLRIASNSWADTPLKSLLMQIQVVDSVAVLTYTANGIEDVGGTTGNAAYQEDQTLHLRTPPITIPAGATISNLRCQIVALMGAAITNSKILTLATSRWSLWDVTGD